MGLIDLESIPEYREACAEERAARDLALLADPMPLCGVIVDQHCPRHTLRLGYCRNAFVTPGKIIGPLDVAMFLWFVSREYTFDVKKRDRFVKRIRKLPMAETTGEINGYLENAFLDMPQGSTGGAKMYVAPVTIYVDLLAAQYGWGAQQTLTTPWGTIFQLVKRIRQRANPKAIMFNPRSDAALGRWLEAQHTRGAN